MREIKNDPRFPPNKTYDEALRSKTVIKNRNIGPTELPPQSFNGNLTMKDIDDWIDVLNSQFPPKESSHQRMMKGIAIIEESFLKNALKDFLKREPGIEDFKKCEKVYQQENITDYFFCYDGTRLGKVKFELTHNGYRVQFIP